MSLEGTQVRLTQSVIRGVASRPYTMGRGEDRHTATEFGFLIGMLLIGTGCSSNHETVQFEIDNQTDSLVCLYPSRPDAAGGRCLKEAEPGRKKAWGLGCAYGKEADKAPLTIVMTVKERGRRIYDRTEECRVWQNSERTFVIEQRGEEFVVVDPLPDSTSSP